MEMAKPICSGACVDLMNTVMRSRGSVRMLSVELYVPVSRFGPPRTTIFFSLALSLAKSVFKLCALMTGNAILRAYQATAVISSSCY